MPAREQLRTARRPGNSGPGRRPLHVGAKSLATSERAPADVSYLRAARRLRLRYAGQPDLLQASLRELSRRHDRANQMTNDPPAPGAARPSRAAVPATVTRVRPAQIEADPPTFGRAVVNWFADRVAQTVDAKLLMFSERHELLKTAQRLGIDRFHANLIVAVAQHQAEERGKSQSTSECKASTLSLAPVMLIVAVQSLILSAGWWILH